MHNIKLIWSNGKLIPFEDTRVSILSHSLHYGSAVFEGIRCYMTKEGPAIFRLKDHVNRLFHSASVMGMNVPYSKGELVEAVKLTVRENELKECYIRPLFFYGEKMGLLPLDAPLNCVVIAWPWDKYFKKDSVSVKISSFERISPRSAVMSAKVSGHYSNSIIASLEAKNAGYDEALLLDYKGNIAEGPGENIFLFKGDTFYTPKEDSILSGITRDSVILFINNMGFKVEEKDIKPEDIESYDEAFFVGTATEVNAIGKIESHVFGEGKEGLKTKEVKDTYKAIVSGKIPMYKNWLEYIK